ncbi:hypothetical protein B0H66DRAFT_569081 [Apodospora peruviana]|uniref:DUF676 domain-containing protein n=1 Tax=Apodospora peruviana TaxID=516989 RepID=A0AAE0LZ17_9PEZI|nr:hypothetical protein B0H66DRAFT_569081 [Apodospora peruviana]
MTKGAARQKRSRSFGDKLFGRVSWSSTTTATSTSIPSVVDSNPYGIKVLYTAPTVDPVADVIFIHGIKGHREHTWSQGADGQEPWPQTLLPLRIPNVRILTFGYDANPIAWRVSVSVNRIGDHSNNLLGAIAMHRQDNKSSSTRPIIFVAHSLGGLVCKDALLSSRSSADERIRRIYECTSGIIFLGTPHSGASLATVAHRLARLLALTTLPKSNLRILRVLEKDSEVLARIQADFYALLQTPRQRRSDGMLLKPLTVSCFHEELKYPGLGEVIVPADSAVLHGYGPGLGIHAHHKDIARFGDENAPGFESVVGELQRLINEIGIITDSSKEPDAGPSGKEGDAKTGRQQLYGGIEIWGNVIKSNVVSGNQTVHGDLKFGGG